MCIWRNRSLLGHSEEAIAIILGFELQIIDACMRLHNFIIDSLESNLCLSGSTALDWDVFDDDCRRYLATHLK